MTGLGWRKVGASDCAWRGSGRLMTGLGGADEIRGCLAHRGTTGWKGCARGNSTVRRTMRVDCKRVMIVAGCMIREHRVP
jgi:hypothetical protein